MPGFRRSPSASLGATLLLGACLLAQPSAAQAGPAVEQWGSAEVVLSGPVGRQPVHRGRPLRPLHAGRADGRRPGLLRRRGRLPGPLHARSPGRLALRDAEQSARAGRQDGPVRRGRSRRPANHGPVRVRDTFHFAYADGTPYFPIGTTCYAWTHQGDALEEADPGHARSTPRSTSSGCASSPSTTRSTGTSRRITRSPGRRRATGTSPGSNPAFFRHLEQRIGQLRDLGIEADLILFHPYDKGHWGFDRMTPDADDRYLRYVVARLAAYRNVWWSLANEWDFMKEKTEADWDRFFGSSQRATPTTTSARSTTAPCSTTTPNPG